MSMCSLQKEAQSDLIAGWKDSTKKHLRSCYLNFMTDANLLTVIDKRKPLLRRFLILL